MKPSQDMPNNTRLNNKAIIVQELQHAVRIWKVHKINHKKYLECEFNYENFQRIFSICLDYHQKVKHFNKTPIDSNLQKHPKRFKLGQNSIACIKWFFKTNREVLKNNTENQETFLDVYFTIKIKQPLYSKLGQYSECGKGKL